MSQQPETGGDALARAEQNFAAAKEACRTGHSDAEGTTCTYGGMSSAHGYWLASEDCEANHGELCDLRALCDGADTETGFRGSEPDPESWYWIWRVTACQPCADLYVSAHPEWRRPDPDGPKPTYDEIMARLHEEVEASRAAMSPAEREASDMVTNHLLYGQHPAPKDAPQFTGLAGLFGDSITLDPVATPIRDRPPPSAGGSLSADAVGRALQGMRNPALHAPPPSPAPPAGSTATGLFDALGGVTPVSPRWPGAPTETERVPDWALRTDEAANGPLGRAQWAPATCICPWPWPTADGHVRLDCPHYTAAPKPIVGRNPQIGCRKVDGTYIHGRPHDCPKWMRSR